MIQSNTDVTTTSNASSWDFILQHQRIINQECINILGHTADAEDAAAEVTLRLYRFLNESPEAHQRIAYPRAWVRQVARNYSIDYYRQRARHQTYCQNVDDLSQFEHDQCPEKKNRLTQAVNLLADAIAELPQGLQSAVLLRCIEGESYASLSEQSDITEANARKRVQLARKQLRKKVPDYITSN